MSLPSRHSRLSSIDGQLRFRPEQATLPGAAGGQHVARTALAPWNGQQVTRGFTLWISLSVLGVGIIALPDDAPRVFSFSEGHGPSILDLPGVILVLAGWLAFLVPL